MHELLSTLNTIYKFLDIINLHINCLPLNMNNRQVYDLIPDIPLIDYNLMVSHIFIKTNKEEKKELLKELINNTNIRIIDDVLSMKNYIKQIMIEDVKYRIRNLEREYSFIGYNLIFDFKNINVYKIIKGDLVTIFKNYFIYEPKDYVILNEMKQFMRKLFDDLETLLIYHLKKENHRLLKINEEKMKNLLDQFLEILINTKLKCKTYDTLPTILEINHDEVQIEINNFIETKRKVINEFIAFKKQNPLEIKNLQKLCNQSFKKTKEKAHELILKILRKQLEETNVRGLLNNTLLINSLSNQIEFYEFCKEEIFNHRVNNFLKKIEEYDMKIYKIENSPSPER